MRSVSVRSWSTSNVDFLSSSGVRERRPHWHGLAAFRANDEDWENAARISAPGRSLFGGATTRVGKDWFEMFLGHGLGTEGTESVTLLKEETGIDG